MAKQIKDRYVQTLQPVVPGCDLPFVQQNGIFRDWRWSRQIHDDHTWPERATVLVWRMLLNLIPLKPTI